MRSLLPAAEGFFSDPQRTVYLAEAWQITRQDGAVLRFTSARKRVTLHDGNEYRPAGGWQGSAQTSGGSEGLSRDTLGVLTSELITEDDLRGGLYDGAEIIQYVFDWRWPWEETGLSDKLWIRRVEWTGEKWEAVLSGVTGELEEGYGEVHDPECPVDLGSQGLGQCNVDLDALGMVKTGTVSAVNDSFLEFTTSGLLDPDGWYDDGKVLWDSGDNVGSVQDIRAFVSSGEVIALQFETPKAIQVGDTFTIKPGCNKQLGDIDPQGHCINKFSNGANHQGANRIPGKDRMIRSS